MSNQEILPPELSQPRGRRGGARPGAGRPLDSKTIMVKEVKAMILAALQQVGGVDYLVMQAAFNPGIFCALIAKILPPAGFTDDPNPDEQVTEIRYTVVLTPPKK